MVGVRRWLTVVTHVVLVLGVAVVAFPIYVTFVASSHTLSDLLQSPMPMLPGAELIGNYVHALFTGARAVGVATHRFRTPSSDSGVTGFET